MRSLSTWDAPYREPDERERMARAHLAQTLQANEAWGRIVRELADALVLQWHRATSTEARDVAWYRLDALRKVTEHLEHAETAPLVAEAIAKHRARATRDLTPTP